MSYQPTPATFTTVNLGICSHHCQAFFTSRDFLPSYSQRIWSLAMDGVLNMPQEHYHSALKSWDQSLLDCHSDLALPLSTSAATVITSVTESLPVVETEVKCPDPLISRDLLPNHRGCGQQSASSCPLLWWQLPSPGHAFPEYPTPGLLWIVYNITHNTALKILVQCHLVNICTHFQ